MNAMGSSVVVGIASTKLLGILVLAFAPSSLFKLYYFRMYLFIIILGVFNGLAFLPIVLSLVGPPQVSRRKKLRKLLGKLSSTTITFVKMIRNSIVILNVHTHRSAG